MPGWEATSLKVLLGSVALGGLAQSLAGAAAGLLAQAVGGSAILAGAPQTMLVIGGAAAAVPLSRLAARTGRAVSLATGCALGALGSGVIVVAIMVSPRTGSPLAIAAVLLGSVSLGVGNTAMMLARYAGPQLRPDIERGRALAVVLAATSVGAVLGPNLLAPSAHLTAALLRAPSVPPVTGAYAISGATYVLATAVAWFLRTRLPVQATPNEQLRVRRTPGRRPLNPNFVRGTAVLGLSNLVMVGVMTMAPVQLHHQGSSLTVIGLIVSAHIAAMFAPAPVSGWLTTRMGARNTGFVGAGVLAVASLSAAMLAQGPLLGVAVIMLGAGWNLSLVSGSVLLTEGCSDVDRPRRESLGEAGSGAAAIVGGLGASLLSGTVGYPTLGVVGAVVSAALIPVLATGNLRRATQPAAVPASAHAAAAPPQQQIPT